MLGSIFGSFANLLINRKINNESIVRPQSHCDSCGHRLGPFDLIPILSFIFLRARCRYCKERIPISNLIMEITSALLALLSFNQGQILKSILVFTSLITGLIIAVIDLKTSYIYMGQVVFLSGLGLVYRVLYLKFDKDFILITLIFILVYWLIYHLSKGGLGDGDIYYYLALFLFLPSESILYFILISIWLGALAGLIIAYKEKSLKVEMPFCIYIFLSFIISFGVLG